MKYKCTCASACAATAPPGRPRNEDHRAGSILFHIERNCPAISADRSQVLTLPLRAFVRFGEPLYHVVQFVERFPQFRL